MQGVTAFLIFLFAIGAITSSAFALEENGVLESPFTENPPAIDGRWTTEGEWSDANVIYMERDGQEIYLLVKHDRNYIYFMFDAISDQIEKVKGKESYHLAYLMFDTNNDGGSFRKSDDIRFIYGEAFNDEGKMADFDSKNRRINRVTTGDPSTTGFFADQIINEPTQFSYTKSFSSRNSPYEPGRDHYIHEFRIPISFLHRSDVYGFGAGYQTGTFGDGSDSIFVRWPQTLQQSWIPEQYGNLVAIGNTITAPPIPVISVSTDQLSFGNVAISEKSGPKKVTIKNEGTGKLKISSISVSGQFSFSGIKTPLDLEPGESASFDAVFAPLTLDEKSGSISISSNDLSKPTVRITTTGAGVEKGALGGGCLVATATYGTELAPQVQLLREVRQNTLLATNVGITFLNVFNDAYYSFSPTVADWERQNPAFKELVKVAITPMLSSLSILNYVDVDSESEMLGYGVGIILLNIGMYFAIPAILILKIRRKV